MKRFLCLTIVMTILMTGCAKSNTVQTKSPEITEESEERLETSEKSEKYKTLLSQDNKLSIVRKPGVANYFNSSEKMTELPKYNSNSGDSWQVDLRSRDLTNLDLSGRIDDLFYADFDSKIKWPDKLPDGFDPNVIMELGKNPGLGLRELHKKGITGKRVGIAIIDQGLLVDHVEYKDQLKMYEEIHCGDEGAQMHGPGVASIAVGKTVGVAPEADLYYIAETHGIYNENGEFEYDLTWTAKSINRIIEINKTLPEDKKIRVISISLGIGEKMNGYKEVFESIKKAKQEGIYTVYVGSEKYMGLGRNSLKDADDIVSYTKGEFWKDQKYNNSELLIPMDSRCVASPTGINDYVFYREGGMSWTVPYVAGLYALACQVKPDITPNVFWKLAFNTSDMLITNNSTKEKLGKIVNPVKLIETIETIK